VHLTGEANLQLAKALKAIIQNYVSKVIDVVSIVRPSSTSG